MDLLPPTFLVCGIQKGGTTALHAYLKAHPDVFCPARKELNFFDANWSRGMDWYRDQFAGSESAVAVGEASPHYMRFARAAKRIAAHAPDAKLIFILRDPVARAWSNYTYNLSRGEQDPRQSFAQAVESEEGYARYLDKGFYQRDLERFASVCGAERMLVLFAECLRERPFETLDTTFQFIGVDPDRWKPRIIESNPTYVPRSPVVLSALYRWAGFRNSLRPLVPDSLARGTRRLRRAARGAILGPFRPPALEEREREYLQDLYAESNRRLSEWLASSGVSEGPRPEWIAPVKSQQQAA